jgi:hypothetical protein
MLLNNLTMTRYYSEQSAKRTRKACTNATLLSVSASATATANVLAEQVQVHEYCQHTTQLQPLRAKQTLSAVSTRQSSDAVLIVHSCAVDSRLRLTAGASRVRRVVD